MHDRFAIFAVLCYAASFSSWGNWDSELANPDEVIQLISSGADTPTQILSLESHLVSHCAEPPFCTRRTVRLYLTSKLSTLIPFCHFLQFFAFGLVFRQGALDGWLVTEEEWYRLNCLLRKSSGEVRWELKSKFESCVPNLLSYVVLNLFVFWKCCLREGLALARLFSCAVRNESFSIWRSFTVSLNSELH